MRFTNDSTLLKNKYIKKYYDKTLDGELPMAGNSIHYLASNTPLEYKIVHVREPNTKINVMAYGIIFIVHTKKYEYDNSDMNGLGFGVQSTILDANTCEIIIGPVIVINLTLEEILEDGRFPAELIKLQLDKYTNELKDKVRIALRDRALVTPKLREKIYKKYDYLGDLLEKYPEYQI